jgi:hypothetical protein
MIIKFPMSQIMQKRVNQNRSYERALDAAYALMESHELYNKELAAKKYQLDVQKLFTRRK